MSLPENQVTRQHHANSRCPRCATRLNLNDTGTRHAPKVEQWPVPADTANPIARYLTHINEIDSATYTELYEPK
jgi:hypothetical protein